MRLALSTIHDATQWEVKMKLTSSIAVLTCLYLLTGCKPESELSENAFKPAEVASNSSIADEIVEVSCGQCQFGMEGSGCGLAVRIDGKPYYVDGSSIDDHGDAHGEDGLCNCVRTAKVTGEIKEGRFVAKSFSILPNEK
jgi:hypothetical protein